MFIVYERRRYYNARTLSRNKANVDLENRAKTITISLFNENFDYIITIIDKFDKRIIYISSKSI